MNTNTVFEYIKEQEKMYSQPVELEDGWNWSMKEHLRRSFLYLNSQFTDDNDDRTLRPNKNIVLPILNVQYRTEGFDVKDIELYVDNPDDFYKSLLIKKYHTRWALENELDTFIDDMVESYCTYGGVLVRKTGKARPEVVDLRTLAFADQEDLLNNPFAIKHQLSFSQLREQAKARNWGGEGSDIDIESLIELVKKEGKSKVDIYEVHGSMPTEWLSGEEIIDQSEMDVNQIQIVAFYMKEGNQMAGVTLFKKQMPKLPFKFLKRDDIQGRALGRGGVEELFESQIWTNWNEIKVTEMLESASKTILWSDDNKFKTTNNLHNIDNGEILGVEQGKTIQQLDTYPRNVQLFNDSLERWQQLAQILGSASDPLLGETPSSGTPFKLYEAQQVESKSLHKYRQGKLAVFMDEIYRDWILPHISKEIVKEQIFMSELSSDEMEMVVNQVVDKETNKFKKRMILAMEDLDEELLNEFKNQVRQDFIKKGNKKFFEILKGEMKDISLSVMTNIAGKQKNLALLTDKLVNVLRQYIATPQIRQDPEMTKLLNTILESSGLSPIMFGSAPQLQTAPIAQANGNTQGLQGLSESNQQVN